MALCVVNGSSYQISSKAEERKLQELDTNRNIRSLEASKPPSRNKHNRDPCMCISKLGSMEASRDHSHVGYSPGTTT